jgi:DNA-binding IclR family transcriptional regulator
MLNCFRSDRPQRTLAELADEAKLTMSTAHRIVKALQDWGYIVQDESGRVFSLGPTVMKLAQVFLQRDNQHELVLLAQPFLERLRDATGETVALHCPVDTQRVCVSEVPSRQPVRMANGVGNLYPLHSGAAGKVILAWSSTTTLDRVLATLADEARSGGLHERLVRELPRIRKKGYALSLGETVPSASAIAVPIFSASRLVAGSLSIAGPIDRWKRELMLDHAPLLLATGKDISTALGYAGTQRVAPPENRG